MIRRRLLPTIALTILAVVVLGACGSAGNGGIEALTAVEPTSQPVDYPSRPAGPADCTTGIPAAQLLAERASVEQMRTQLPLMKELQRDTKLVWEQFAIQPDHLMVDGWPKLLISIDEADGRCDEILEALEFPELAAFVEWTEEAYSDAFDLGGMPPWRTLIGGDLDAAGGENGDQVWTSMGTGLHGITSVSLHADQEELAAVLNDRYDDLITLTVGNFAYPQPLTNPGATRTCGTVPLNNPPAGVVISSAALRGTPATGIIDIVVANNGESTVHLVPERIAELSTPGSDQILTSFDGAMTQELRGSMALEPGNTVTINSRTSIAPCSPGDGYALGAGRYDFVLPIHIFDQPADESRESNTVLIARVGVELS